MREIRDAIASTFEDFNFIIQALDKVIGLTINKIIGDHLEVDIPQCQVLHIKLASSQYFKKAFWSWLFKQEILCAPQLLNKKSC